MDEPFNDCDFKSEVAAYRIENDNLKRDYEKITIDYELKIEHLKKEINLKTVNYENLFINFQELDGKYKNICQEKIEVNQNYFDLSQEKFNIVKKFDNLESEHATLLELISRREKEVINSKNEIQELKVQLTEFKNNEIELKLNKNDLEYRRKDFERLEQMSINRNNKLCADIKMLEEKLIECKKENFDEKSQHNKIIYDINLDLETKRNEIKAQKRLNEKLKEKISHLERVNEEQTDSLRSAVESQTSIDNLLRKELTVQTSISDLYKEERDECLVKEKNLINAITELQESLKETYEESDKMKVEYESKLSEYSQQISELRHEINKKEKELTNANELLDKFRVKGLSEEELRALNPATASAISALKRGYSMTEIYSEYLQIVNERDELRVDRDRLNQYMLSILDELEQKAPMLKKQQDEHSSLELTISLLGKKYDDNLSHLLNCQSELTEYRSKCDDLTKKLRREEQTCADLGQQVCCLIREIETYRGTVVRSDDEPQLQVSRRDEPELISRMRNFNQRSLMHRSHSSLGTTNSLEGGGCGAGSRFVTAKDVITKHLVTFKNICELQQQNIHLLEQFRDISEQQEATENLINENSMQELAKKLELAYRELDEIKAKQVEYKQMNKTIEGQKHIIHALTMLNGKSDFTVMLGGSSMNFDVSPDEISQSLTVVGDGTGDKRVSHQSNLIATLNGKLVENQDKIEKLYLEINGLRTEKEALKEKHSDVTEELNRKIADAKMTNANLLAKISYNQEKTSSLEQNLINRQLEMSDLQNELAETNQQLAQKTEETKSTNNALLNSQMRLKELEVETKRLQENQKHIESLEEQIGIEKNEKYQLIMSTSNLANQISNLQAVLTKPQPDEGAEKQIELKSRIKQLSLELKQEKSKYQNSLEMWQAKFSECTGKIDSLTSQLTNANRSNPVANLVISDSRTIVDVLHNTPEKREKTSDLENQLEDLIVSNNSLKKQLESYQDLMSNSESKLISNAQLIEEMEARFQEKIDEERQKSSDIEETLENIQLAYEQIEGDYKSVKKALEDQIEDLTKKLNDTNTLANSLNSEIDKTRASEAQLKIDLDRQRNLTKEATENYQQELIFHAQESDALQVLEEQMGKHKKHERDLSEKLQEAILVRDQLQSELDKSTAVRTQEKEQLEKEITDLRTQKESLNNRLFDLNEHVINLKKMIDPSIESGIDQAVVLRESHWEEVIQYLRQEKESAEKIKNQFEIDLHRCKVQCSQQEEVIAQLNTALEEERKFKVLEAETSKQHSEVMRKLELGQMLSESNAMLRQDRERLKDELEEKAKRLDKLQQIVEPLRTELKAKIGEVESIKLDARSLENERDLWRKRCDTLIEKSKQVNPEDFKQICMEKDRLQHQLLLDEEKCRLHVTKIEEMQNEIDSHIKSLQDLEEQHESLKRANEDNIGIIQRRDGLIVQLKEIGRKYRAETESQKVEIDQKEEKIRELQSAKKELVETKASLEESRKNLQQYVNQATTSGTSNSLVTDEFLRKLSSILSCPSGTEEIVDNVEKLLKDNQNHVQLLKVDSEQKLRNQAIERHLSKLIHENERLTKQVDSMRYTQEDDLSLGDTDTTADVMQPTSTWHTVPTVARVAANVHPVVQKPQHLVSASNQISPNSQPVSSCTSTARQTAEIRPIHAVSLHLVASNTGAVDTTDTVSAASVTTSLPASVVQALAASSVSTVIFPAVTSASSAATTIAGSISTVNRLKRCFDDTIEQESRTVQLDQQQQTQQPCSSSTLFTEQHSSVKKLRQDLMDPDVTSLQSAGLSDIDRYEPDDVYEEEVEIESEDVENVPEVVTEDEDIDHKLKENIVDDNLLEVAEEEKNEAFSDNVASEEEEEGDYDEGDFDEDNDDNNDGEDEDGGEGEEDDDEDIDEDDEDDDDENPDVIDLLSTDDDEGDDGSGNANSNNNDKYGANDDGKDVGGEGSHAKGDNNGSTNDEEFKDGDYEQSRKKIEPIVWGDNNRSTNNNASEVMKFGYTPSPPKLGQPIKMRSSMNFAYRRKIAAPRRNYGFGQSRGMSLGGRGGGISQCGRRSGGPFKGNSFSRP